jgi:phosphoribosyl-ATP pyrophosphohydrolase
MCWSLEGEPMSDSLLLEDLWDVIADRAARPSGASYVSRVLQDKKGMDKALEKLGEESIEFILAAKNRARERIVSEGADLLFHFLIALYASGVTFDDVLDELARRRK